MVKLASARESRLYGSWLARNRLEYVNAGLYVFATILLCAGFVSQLSIDAKSGLVILLIALALITVVNLHDLMAHMAGIDYRFSLMAYDLQLALVEFAVPVVQALGSIVFFLGILFLFIQTEKGHRYSKLEKHAFNLLIAGPVLWLIGSIHNLCQTYERADSHVQILQACVHIPFLMGSFLFVVGAILGSHGKNRLIHHGWRLSGNSWIWFSIFGSLLFLIGGLMNVEKVFKMQQMDGVLRLEKLRGGAQEKLSRDREGQVPLILEEQRRKKQREEVKPIVVPTPYKDALLSHS